MKIKKVLSGVMALLLCLVFVVACAPSEAGGTEITVTYNYNYEGAPAAAVETIEESDVAPIPENPVRDRYAFTGWYTDAACTEKFDFEEALYEDVTIYAGWELAEVLVTFDYNHDSTVEVKEAAVGGTISQPADPQWDGHLFTGWYTDAACTEKFDFATVIEQDTTIYAGWEEVSGDVVTITYMWNYDGAPNDGVCNVASVQKGRKTTAYAANRGEEFYLEGWYTDAACTKNSISTSASTRIIPSMRVGMIFISLKQNIPTLPASPAAAIRAAAAVSTTSSEIPSMQGQATVST